MYTVYMLRCNDGSLYTGIARDVKKRFAQHQAGVASRYTRSRGVNAIVYIERKRTKGGALKREYAIKQLSRIEKEALIVKQKKITAQPLYAAIRRLFGVRVVRRRIRVRRSIAGSREEYLRLREQARIYVERRLAEMNMHYQYTYNSVRIKNQKTRWGSCSARGNINIHYRVLLLRPELADYVLVHELCHLKELNHSAAFWALVQGVVPQYQQLRDELQRIR